MGDIIQSQETNSPASGARISTWVMVIHIGSFKDMSNHQETSLILIIAGGDVQILPSPFSKVQLTPCNIGPAH